MAYRNAVEIITDSKVEAKRPLHVRRLLAGDGQAKCGGGPVHDIFEGIEIVDGHQ
jgi:hypothetical protein